jgi:hypothetical protein
LKLFLLLKYLVCVFVYLIFICNSAIRQVIYVFLAETSCFNKSLMELQMVLFVDDMT